MLPYVTLFGREFSMYAICTLIGVLTAGLFACLSIKRFAPSDRDDMLRMLLLSCIGVMIGGHLLYALTNWKVAAYVCTHLELFDTFGKVILAISYVFGGSVFYGGFLGGALVGLWYIRRKKLDLAVYTDVAAPVVPLFHCFGRIGCFLGGCCYGVESSVGFVYEHSLIESANGVRRLPIQLIEAGFNLLLFAVLATLLYRGIAKGRLMPIYVMTYALGRFVFEFFRGDRYRGIWFGFSTSQWIALLLFVGTGLWWIVHSRRQHRAEAGERTKMS